MFIIKNMKAVFKAVATVFMLLAFVANGVCAEIPVKTGVSVDGRVAPFLMTYEKKYPGMKPLRTYSGPRYIGGVSDHCPIVLCIFGSY